MQQRRGWRHGGREFLMKEHIPSILRGHSEAPPTTGCSWPTCGPLRGWPEVESRCAPRQGRSAADLSIVPSARSDRRVGVYCKQRCSQPAVPGEETD